MIQGYPKFTGITLGELTVNRMTAMAKISAKMAFIDPKTGSTYGWTNIEGGSWSEETRTKLNELIQSMEQDAARVVFENDSVQTSSTDTAQSGPVGGLGEHLNGDAPSV